MKLFKVLLESNCQEDSRHMPWTVLCTVAVY